MPSKLGKYNILQTLGKGGYSKVKLAQSTSSQKYYAIKIHKANDPEFTEDVKNTVLSEVKTISKLKHPNLIQIVAYMDKAKVEKKDGSTYDVECVIVEELAMGGELFFYVLNSGYFKESLARYFFRQVLDGLEYMHTQGFAHRDIKPDNLLFDEHYNLKIADFGFAGPLKGRYIDGYLTTTLGTRPYMAPEIFEKRPYKGELVDVFALGVCLFIMVAGTPPFNEAKKDEFYYKFVAGEKWHIFWKYHTKSKPSGEKFFSGEFKDLIQLMFSYDDSKRGTLKVCREHAWTQQEVPTHDQVKEECKVRKEINDEKKEEEKKQKMVKKAYKDRDRGFGDEEEEEKKEEKVVLSKVVDEYVQIPGKMTQFFVELHPDRIMFILESLNENQQQIQMGDNNDDEEVEEEQLKVKVHDKQYKAFVESENLGLTFNVKVMKVKERVYCIDFRPKLGEIYDFFTTFKRIQDVYSPFIIDSKTL